MARKVAVPMKNNLFGRKYLLSIIDILQNFEVVFNVRVSHKRDLFLILEDVFIGPVGYLFNAMIRLLSETRIAKEVRAKSYFVVVKLLLNYYVIDDNITVTDNGI